MSKLLRIKDVLELVPLSKSRLYLLIRDNEFPKPIKLGKISVWVESDVRAFIKKLINNRGV